MISPALFAWAVTVGIETPCVASVYPGRRWRMALACAVATSVTNLAMNLLLPSVLGSGPTFVLVGELGALVLEAAAYWAIDRAHDPGRALAASALANGMSFAAGLVLPWTI